MEWLGAGDYWAARWLLQRGLGALYLVAFVGVLTQFRPLLGERGLLPVNRTLSRLSFRRAPSLFAFGYSDRRLVAVGWAGVALALVAVTGLADRGPVWVPTLVWLALWALYLSVANVGRIFYAFGWESLLLEAGFLAIFLGPGWMEPPLLSILLVRWLLFRVEFGAGLIKLRGDRCWRDLSCLDYHHETQPLPGPFSWRFHHLPRLAHRVEVAGNHAAQLVAPVLLFLPQPFAGIGGGVIIASQLWLVASGNFAWLNWLTIVLAFAALPDAVLAPLLPVEVGELAAAPAWFGWLALAATALVVVLSWWPVRNMASRDQRMNASYNPLHLVNTYGAFGTVTRHRDEIVLEGTDDDPASDDATWHPYEFRAKPGDPYRRPPPTAPYHLRLDWLMWFAAMSPPQAHPWLLELVAKLLDGDPGIRRLLRHDPFAGHGVPRAIRALRYRYRFTTPQERRATGAWWHRSLIGEHLPPLERGGQDGRPRFAT